MLSSATTAASSSWLKLSQKTAIVTGAASGIGAAVSRALVAQGCRRVFLVDRQADKLDEMLSTTSTTASWESCGITKTQWTSLVCDVGDEAQVQTVMATAFQSTDANESPPPSILINCAGITQDSFVTKMTMDQWNAVVNVNLTGTFLMCREFIRCHDTMLQNVMDSAEIAHPASNSTASIVNVGSVVAKYGNVGQANYASSKGGVTGLTKALAKECASRMIRVNAVLPGFVDTAMVQAVPDKVKAQIIPKIALQRMAQPHDVANLILFLASCERSGYITGECIECSGMIAL